MHIILLRVPPDSLLDWHFIGLMIGGSVQAAAVIATSDGAVVMMTSDGTLPAIPAGRQ